MAQRTGLRGYSGQEIGNLALGQNGFDCFTSGTSFAQSAPTGIWIAIKVLSTTATGVVKLYATTKTGDNLSDNGATGEVTMAAGDIIYGPFDKIVTASIGAGESMICYRG